MIKTQPFVLCLLLCLGCFGTAFGQLSVSSVPGLVLSADGPCATQTFVLEGPSFDPRSDSLAPVTTLSSSGASAGKRLPSFILPWTPIATGSSLDSARALRTGQGSSLHLSYQNGIELWLGENAGLRLQAKIAPGQFKLDSGDLWLKSYRQSVSIKTDSSTVKLDPGSAIFLRRNAEGEKLWLLEGKVEWDQPLSTGPAPFQQKFNELAPLREGRFEEALPLLQDGTIEDKVLGAAVRIILGDPDGAFATYQELLSADPDRQGIRLLLGVLIARTGDLEGSLAELERVEGSFSPLSAAVRGYLLYQSRRHKEALKIVERALEEDRNLPKLVESLLLTIQALCSDDPERSIQILSGFHKANPEDPFLANDLGIYLASQGRLKASLKYLSAARHTSRLNPYIRLNLSTVYTLLGQQNRAQSELTLLEILTPSSGIVKQSLALNYAELKFGAASTRLSAQSTALDPLLIAPGGGEIVLNSTYIEGRPPQFFANLSRRIGPAAVSVAVNSEKSDFGNQTNASLEFGAPIGKGAMTGLITRRENVVGGFGQTDTPAGLLVYQVPVSDRTRLWAAGSYELPNSEAVLLGINQIESRNTGLEFRLDHQLSARNSLSGGVSYASNESTLDPDLETKRLLVSRNVDRLWVQDTHLFGKRAILTGGLGLDRLRGADTVINPYLGLIINADRDTTISLGILRQSDIPQLGDPEQQGRFQLLERPLISSTTLFPIRDEERVFIRTNSGDLQSLPLWDYRLQVRRSLGANFFGVLEAYRTDVMPSDIANRRLDPLLKSRPGNGRSTLRGVRLEGDFQTPRALGSFSYVYRDYRKDDGSRWVLVPRHELKSLILVPVAKGTAIGLIPIFLEGLETPGGERSVGSLSAFLRIPLAKGTLNLGYAGLLSSDRDLVEGGLLVNLILKF